MVVRFWIIIVPLHSTGKGCISMDTTADKTLSVASVPETQGMEQNIKDWAQYSQWIAAAMSKRMSELGLTQKMLAGKMGCTQQYICRWKPSARLKMHWALRLSKT